MQGQVDTIILDEMDDLVYVADINTYDLLYVNKGLKDLFQLGDCIGKKCYETLQNQTKPCEFCNNSKLSHDKFYIWEHKNELKDTYFLLKDKLIYWNGHQSRLEIALDITEKENSMAAVRERLAFEKTLIDCVRELAVGKSLRDGMKRLLERLAVFYEAKCAGIIQFPEDTGSVQVLYFCGQDGKFQTGKQYPLEREVWTELREVAEQNIRGEVKRLEEVKNTYKQLYRYGKEEGISCFASYPMSNREHQGCYLMIVEPKKNEKWIELLESLSFFVETEIFKNQVLMEMEELNAELEMQNDRFTTLQKLSQSLIFEYDIVKDNMVLFSGERINRHMEHFRDDLVHVIHPDELENVKRAFYAALQGTVFQVLELRTNLFHGEFLWYRAVVTTIYGKNNKEALRLIGRLENVEKEKSRRRINEVLLERMQLAVNQSYMLAIALDLTLDRYVLIQKKDMELQIETEGSCMAFIRGCSDRMHPDDRYIAEQFLNKDFINEQFGDEGDQLVYEARLYRYKEKNYFWFENTVIRVEDPVNKDMVLLLLVRDINHYKLIETSLRSTLRSLEGANQAKSDFLSRVSHDIRTPINGVIGMTEIAKEVPGNPVRTLACLDKIKTSGDYLLRLVNNILEMSKIESGKLELNQEVLYIEELADSLHSVFSYQTEEKGIDFEVELEGITKEPLLGDRLKVTQVLTNLVGNAVKFTEPGGHIRLRIRQNHRDDRKVFLQFWVQDDGIGISEDFQDKIFDSFSQEKRTMQRTQTGSGLGLSICKSIVTFLGGTIAVKSRLGQGTVFDVRLPFEIAEHAELADFRNRQDTGNRGSESGMPDFPETVTVLLVEDNELNAEISEYFLQKLGIKVEKAGNGADAVHMLQESEEGYYSMILMDIMMPVMGGYEATRRIRELNRGDAAAVPIIAMTANAFQEDVARCLACGMNGHLAKPIETELLKKIVLKWIPVRGKEE